MNQQGEDRCIEIARYIIETGATVRAAAQHFGISKSTVPTMSHDMERMRKKLE